MEPLLTANHIGKSFGTAPAFQALADASITLNSGEFVSILGPSGCGKTTLLRICAGLMTANAGEIRYKGSVGPASTGEYGMVFQQPGLMPWRRVHENVELPGRILGKDKRENRENAAKLLSLVGLVEAARKYPSELSGGMQQRVAIARALVSDPDLLFMDEPFGALDALTRDRMNIELQDIHMRAGKSILFVTHSIREGIFLSDRLYVMGTSPGRIVDEVPIDFPRPRTLETQTSPQFAMIEKRIRSGLSMEATGSK